MGVPRGTAIGWRRRAYKLTCKGGFPSAAASICRSRDEAPFVGMDQVSAGAETRSAAIPAFSQSNRSDDSLSFNRHRNARVTKFASRVPRSSAWAEPNSAAASSVRLVHFALSRSRRSSSRRVSAIKVVVSWPSRPRSSPALRTPSAHWDAQGSRHKAIALASARRAAVERARMARRSRAASEGGKPRRVKAPLKSRLMPRSTNACSKASKSSRLAGFRPRSDSRTSALCASNTGLATVPRRSEPNRSN